MEEMIGGHCWEAAQSSCALSGHATSQKSSSCAITFGGFVEASFSGHVDDISGYW